MAQGHSSIHTTRKGVHVAVFALIVVVWVCLDRFSKVVFEAGELGELVGGPYAGLFQFRLVHNTGGAWGIFSDQTWALGVFSLIVCVALTVYFVATLKQASMVQTVGLALVVAGGIGNAIDRFAQGFVVDVIEFSFMDFPVFNVADMGVTCGLALVIIGMVMSWRAESAQEAAQSVSAIEQPTHEGEEK